MKPVVIVPLAAFLAWLLVTWFVFSCEWSARQDSVWSNEPVEHCGQPQEP